jgi:hypothetical protein
MATDVSRVELVRNQILAALRAIDQENGFRTTPREITTRWKAVDDVQVFPTIAVVMGNRRITKVNDARTVTSKTVQVLVFGYFNRSADTSAEDAKEALLQDVERALHPLFSRERNDPTNPWVFNLKDDAVNEDCVPDFGLDQGLFVYRFSVLIKNQDGEF